ncbi:hypothetical protein P3T21_007676 [Paraburkholderia sp. GAS334]
MSTSHRLIVSWLFVLAGLIVLIWFFAAYW